jgi:hypothetical protein
LQFSALFLCQGWQIGPSPLVGTLLRSETVVAMAARVTSPVLSAKMPSPLTGTMLRTDFAIVVAVVVMAVAVVSE